jgi:hypothetical protein
VSKRGRRKRPPPPVSAPTRAGIGGAVVHADARPVVPRPKVEKVGHTAAVGLPPAPIAVPLPMQSPSTSSFKAPSPSSPLPAEGGKATTPPSWAPAFRGEEGSGNGSRRTRLESGASPLPTGLAPADLVLEQLHGWLEKASGIGERLRRVAESAESVLPRLGRGDETPGGGSSSSTAAGAGTSGKRGAVPAERRARPLNLVRCLAGLEQGQDGAGVQEGSSGMDAAATALETISRVVQRLEIVSLLPSAGVNASGPAAVVSVVPEDAKRLRELLLHLQKRLSDEMEQRASRVAQLERQSSLSSRPTSDVAPADDAGLQDTFASMPELFDEATREAGMWGKR